jgi:hypothetical protein
MQLKQKKRPAFVTWLAWAVLILGAVNLGRVYAGWTRRDVYATLDLSLPIWLPMLSGGMWGLIWLAMAWGLWRRLPWARRWMLIAFPVYELMVIGEQAVFARGAYERGRLVFAIGLAVGLTLFIGLMLNRPRIRQAFVHDDGQDESELS